MRISGSFGGTEPARRLGACNCFRFGGRPSVAVGSDALGPSRRDRRDGLERRTVEHMQRRRSALEGRKCNDTRRGGIRYSAAPFNGWYMGTEIGARNHVDDNRYNVLPAVAQALGIDTQREDSVARPCPDRTQPCRSRVRRLWPS